MLRSPARSVRSLRAFAKRRGEIRCGKARPEAGFHREFHRPHSGFPPWRPRDDAQEIIDEALGYAARSGRVDAMALLFSRGADLDSAPYQATPLVLA